MRNTRVWERACGLQRTVVEDVDFDDVAQAVVVAVRPNAKAGGRCGRCSRRAPRYDNGESRRRWRALDLGTTKVFLEADAPRVQCRTHGPTVAAVPWARHGAGHTRDFDDLAAWLAVRTSKSAVCQLLRVAWRTVGAIVTRVNAEVEARVDRLDGLRRIGIDEISYKRGHRYLIVVVDHDTGALVWAGPGRNDAALHVFFDQLGPERAALLTHVSADMADWIARVVAKRAPNAVRCADPFHVVAWGIDALDVERRRAWNAAAGRLRTGTRPRNARSTGTAARSKRARYALWKNPQDLTDRQQHELDWIAKTDPKLWRAYLLKEALRYVFAVRGDEGKEALRRWLIWARRSQLPAFVDLHRKITAHRAAIDATLEHGLSNALVESTNTKIRLLTRIAFGFHGHEPLVALALLALGPHRPRLPGR
ncbi:MAG: ISL3 family transposase [Microthrixaceae bacterium]